MKNSWPRALQATSLRRKAFCSKAPTFINFFSPNHPKRKFRSSTRKLKFWTQHRRSRLARSYSNELSMGFPWVIIFEIDIFICCLRNLTRFSRFFDLRWSWNVSDEFFENLQSKASFWDVIWDVILAMFKIWPQMTQHNLRAWSQSQISKRYSNEFEYSS